VDLSDDEFALLEMVRDQPEADAPRLVYADWLDEHGDAPLRAWAGFIRTQCALVDLPAGDRRRELLTEQLADLWPVVGRAFTPLGYYHPDDFPRGFPTRHSDRPQTYVAHEPLWSRLAIDLAVTLYRDGDFTRATAADFARLAGCRSLAGWSGLSLADNPGFADCFAALIASPHLRRVGDLELTGCAIGVNGVRELVRGEVLTSLRTLHFNDCAIGDDGVEALTASVRLTGLRELLLIDDPAGNKAAEAIAASPSCSRLERLVLYATGVGSEGARALARSPYLFRVRDLDLRGRHGAALADDVCRELRDRFGDAVRF
jgi:uncharacterized protein (TIGR02996 family)